VFSHIPSRGRALHPAEQARFLFSCRLLRTCCRIEPLTNLEGESFSLSCLCKKFSSTPKRSPRPSNFLFCGGGYKIFPPRQKEVLDRQIFYFFYFLFFGGGYKIFPPRQKEVLDRQIF